MCEYVCAYVHHGLCAYAYVNMRKRKCVCVIENLFCVCVIVVGRKDRDHEDMKGQESWGYERTGIMNTLYVSVGDHGMVNQIYRRTLMKVNTTYIFIHTFTHRHTHIHKHIHKFTSTYTSSHTHVYVWVHEWSVE